MEVAPPRGVRGLKLRSTAGEGPVRVAPPRGVRGLKYCVPVRLLIQLGRTPSWGAWIEIHVLSMEKRLRSSHPLVGCVD